MDENLLRIARKKQELRPLMERFGATEDGPSIANLLNNMVGTRRLELLTSTVSKTSYKWTSGPESLRFANPSRRSNRHRHL